MSTRQHNISQRVPAGKKALRSFLLVIFVFTAILSFGRAQVQAASSAPVLVSAKAVSYNKIKVTWKKVSGASWYNLYYKVAGGKWKGVRSKIRGTSFTHTGGTVRPIKVGVTYYYTVRAVKNGKLSSYNKKGVSAKTSLGRTVLSGAEMTDSTHIKISWKGVGGADGYHVYRKVNGKWKKIGTSIATRHDWTFISSTKNPIVPGQKYTFTVRAYQLVNKKKVFGGYQKAGVSVTVPVPPEPEPEPDPDPDAALNNVADSLMARLISPAASQSQKLRAAWDYICHSGTFSYARSYAAFTGSDTHERAYRFLTTHAGNCYDFACAFAYLAKRIGYTAYVVYGQCPAAGGGLTPHGWVFINGLGYFDPNGEWAEFAPGIYGYSYDPYTPAGRALV